MMIGEQSTSRPAVPPMLTFVLIWFGQLVSIVGSGITRFALGIWIYQQTQSVTMFVWMALFDAIPGIVVAPFAGVVVDRWNRRKVMLVSDAMAAVATLVLAIVITTGELQVWHIYIAIAVSSICSTFQWPAYAAAIPLLVPRQQLGRANGMVQTADAIARIGAPVLAVLLGTLMPLQGILFVDLATFLVAVCTLLFLRIPDVHSSEPKEERQSLISEAAYGWTYLRSHRGLLALLFFTVVTIFMLEIVQVLLAPLVLTFASTAALSMVLSIGGIGALVGGVLMTIWAGPRKRVYGLLVATLLQGTLLLLGGLQPNIPLITAATFLFLCCTPVIFACTQTIWQSKVPPHIQGRVFAARRMCAWSGVALAYLIAGPLADHVFEPLLAVNGPLAASVGQIIGVGPGRGIGLLFIVLGLLTIGVTAAGAMYPRLRRLEDELPDIETNEALPTEALNATGGSNA